MPALGGKNCGWPPPQASWPESQWLAYPEVPSSPFKSLAQDERQGEGLMGRGTGPALVLGQGDHKIEIGPMGVLGAPENKGFSEDGCTLTWVGDTGSRWPGLAWPDSSPTPLWVHTVDKVEASWSMWV